MVFIVLCLVSPPAFVAKSEILILIVKIVLHSVNDGDSTNPEDSTEKKPEPTTANTEENASEESKEDAPSDEESDHTEL